jgi:hypothetical protein
MYFKGVTEMKNQPFRVLFLEDEPTIREVLKEYMNIMNLLQTMVLCNISVLIHH